MSDIAVISVLAAFNGPRRRSTGRAMEARYWCHHCPAAGQRWRSGGATALAIHVQTCTGQDVVNPWPDYQLVDDDGQQVDFEGQPLRIDRKVVPATVRGDGWVRSVPVVIAAPTKDRESR